MRGRDEGEMEGNIFSTVSAALNHLAWEHKTEQRGGKRRDKNEGKNTFTAAFVYLYSLVAESMGVLILENRGLEGLPCVAAAE